MGNGLFASSKNALFFAGGIIACAAIAALTLGSQFTPKAESDYLETRAVTSEGPDGEKSANQIALAQPAEPAMDDLSGFADDSELMDDTNGFDTTPDGEGATILSSEETGGTNGFSDSAFDPIDGSSSLSSSPSVFGDYKPAAPRAKKAPPVRRSGPVKWQPKVNPLPPDPPRGQPFPKDRKIIKLEEPSDG